MNKLLQINEINVILFQIKLLKYNKLHLKFT